jgi:hypothetical protein
MNYRGASPATETRIQEIQIAFRRLVHLNVPANEVKQKNFFADSFRETFCELRFGGGEKSKPMSESQ